MAVGITVPVVLLISLALVMRSRTATMPPEAPRALGVSPTQVSGRSEQFKAPFTYTMPSDWTFAGEGPRSFSLETPGATGTDVIALYSVGGSAGLLYLPAQGVGTSSEAMTGGSSGGHSAFDVRTDRLDP